jgi:hypothetical protein
MRPEDAYLLRVEDAPRSVRREARNIGHFGRIDDRWPLTGSAADWK